MSLREFIIPNNVVRVARFLLDLDQAAIQKRYLPDSYANIAWLQESLDQYLQPKKSIGAPIMFSAIEQIEKDLATLLEATYSFLPCLTQEAQNQLQDFLTLQRWHPDNSLASTKKEYGFHCP